MFRCHALRHSGAIVAMYAFALGAFLPSFVAHADGPCGPGKVELVIGETKKWQITGPVGTNAYELVFVADPIAQVTPFGPFNAQHGVFNIKGLARGSTTAAMSYSFPGTGESGVCSVKIKVKSRANLTGIASATQRPNPTTTVGVRRIASHRRAYLGGGHRRTTAAALDQASCVAVHTVDTVEPLDVQTTVHSLPSVNRIAKIVTEGELTGLVVANNGGFGFHPIDAMGVPGPLQSIAQLPMDVTAQYLGVGKVFAGSPGSDIVAVTLDFNAMNPLGSTNSVYVFPQTGTNPAAWSQTPVVTPVLSHGGGFPPMITGKLFDLDGDGLAEIALARGNSTFGPNPNSAIIMTPVGDGTFVVHANVPAPTSSAAIDFGDFNGDGIFDLVIPGRMGPFGSGTAVLSVLAGTGNVPPAPLFAAPVTVALGGSNLSTSTSIHVDNFDGVHGDDIVITRDTRLQVVTTAAPIPGIGGTPSFNDPYEVNGGLWFTSVSALDMGAEGGMTILASDFFEDTIVHVEPVNQPGEPGRYPGEVRFDAPAGIGDIFGAYIADLNGNGKKDLLLAGSGGLLPWINSSPGAAGTYSFTPGMPTPFRFNLIRAAVTDPGPDGNAGPFDRIAVAVNTDMATVEVAFAHGEPFEPIPEIPAGASIAIADMNGDGRDDLAILGFDISTPVVRIGINNGDGTFTPFMAPASPPFTDPFALAVGDFNGDGFLDIAYGQQHMTHVLLNNGTGTGFSHADTLTAPPGLIVRSIAVADFNGDGRADLVTTNHSLGVTPSSNVRVYLTPPGEGGGAGGSLFEAPDVYDVGPRATHLAVADIDGDGNLDLIVTIMSELSGVTNGAVVLENIGGGDFAHPTFIARTEGRPHSLAIGQLDGPKGPEIVVFCAPHFSGAFTGLSLHTNVVGTDPPPPCALADLNCNGSVGVADLLILLANWGPCADCKSCPADLDGNCNVGVGDLLILLANWG